MNPRHLILLTLLMTVGLFTSAQNKTLKQQLWDRINPCYSMFEDMDEDGKPDYDELIDDAQNGYLKISGAYPTCGCSCSSTVGAYKDAGGQFTFLQTDSWSCEQTESFSSNHKMEDVLPENFGLQVFIPSYQSNMKLNRSVFFLKVEIPHYGTDTKISLEMIPFGINMKSGYPIVYAYTTENADFKYTSIGMFVNDITQEVSLEYILKAEYSKINDVDQTNINKMIGNDWGSFDSKEEITAYLIEMYKAYDLYNKIEFKDVLLGWDKAKSRFYIKEKKNKVQTLSFKDFLLNCKYWGPAC